MSSVGSGSSTVEFLIAFSVQSIEPVEVEYWLTVISRQRTLVCGRPVSVLSYGVNKVPSRL